ncbi:unnamed protein product [Ambrosiozyma monospora]|uniref:Unnamed protein product n=1 Tax=Ambrosiozyma monospora TaxID=43982 RepID=A0ACB5SUD0_AMBMO|nr:unnamed protein product [Ambrosiozyma monospora]
MNNVPKHNLAQSLMEHKGSSTESSPSAITAPNCPNQKSLNSSIVNGSKNGCVSPSAISSLYSCAKNSNRFCGKSVGLNIGYIVAVVSLSSNNTVTLSMDEA